MKVAVPIVSVVSVVSIVSIVSIVSLVALAACGSSGGGSDRSAPAATDGPAAAAPNANPDGVPYPTDNIGTSPRVGERPGNRIANFKFLGYPGGDKSLGLQPLSLASFFDPSGKRYKLVHIQAAATWCTVCRAESEAIATMKAKLEERKVGWLIALAEGSAPGTPSTTKDLDQWLLQFRAPYTHVLDPGSENLGAFHGTGSLPWNANVDARTMELLSSGIGAKFSESEILAELDGWLAKVDATAR